MIKNWCMSMGWIIGFTSWKSKTCYPNQTISVLVGSVCEFDLFKKKTNPNYLGLIRSIRVIELSKSMNTPPLLCCDLLFFFSFPFTLYSLFISMFACNINLLLLIHHQQQLKFNWHGSSICLILGWNLRFNCHNRILKSMSLANRKKRKEKCALNEIALDCPSKRTEKMRSYQPRMFGRFVRHYIMIIRGRCPTK